jgi:hypothetical protein
LARFSRQNPVACIDLKKLYNQHWQLSVYYTLTFTEIGRRMEGKERGRRLNPTLGW